MEAFRIEWCEDWFKGSVRCGVVVVASDENEAIGIVLREYGKRMNDRDKAYIKDGNSVKRMGWGKMQFYHS